MNRRRAFVAAALFGLVWVVVTVSVEREQVPDRIAQMDQVNPSAFVAREPSQDELVPATEVTADHVVVEEALLIASVQVEPEAPCAGGEALVRTSLRSGARDGKVFVDGEPGTTVVLHPEEPGRQQLVVLAHSWDERVERRVVEVDVRDCGDHQRTSRIVTTVLDQHRYAFRLEPLVDATWSLGDGASAHGTHLEHRYEGRASAPQSTYLVSARYVRDGVEQTAYASVTHVEPAGVAARTAFPTVESQGPRFVTFEDGTLTTHRHFHNALDEDFLIETAELRAFPCDGSPPQEVRVPASAVLSETYVVAGEDIDLGLRVSSSSFDAEVCELLVRMHGVAGARVATSTFALETGFPDGRTPVEDRALLATLGAITAAREPAQRGDPITRADIAAYRARAQ